MGVPFNDVARRVIEHPTEPMRVLGPPGSGKTRLLVERFRVLEKRHPGGPTGPHSTGGGEPARSRGDGGVFILAYSTESYRRLAHAVFEPGTARLGSFPVLTYTRLAREIIESSTGRSPFVVADLEERLILDGVIEHHHSEMTSELRSICRTDAFLDAELEVCHILLQNGVEGRALAALEDLASGNPELRDALLLAREFRRSLDTKKALTYYDASWAAVACLREGGTEHPVMKAAAILVEDFQDIDAGQFELLKTIAPPGGPVALGVFGDPLGSVYAFRGTTHAYLTEEFPRLYGGAAFHLPARTRRGALPAATVEALLAETLGEERGAYLPVVVDEAVPVRDENERAIGSGGKEQAVGSGENGRAAVSGEKERAAGPYGAAASFAIEKTRDELDEVWTMASRIAAMLREGAYRAKDIAVITNRKTAYEPILSAAATQRGIPIDTGRARTGVFGDFVDAFLVLVETPGDLIASRAIMTSPLFPALGELFPAREGSGGPAGSGDTRGRGGSAGSGGSRGSGERAGSGPGDALRRFVEDLRGRIDSLPPARRMRVIADRVLDPVCASFSKETGDDSVYRELSNLLDAWDRYTDAVDNWGGGEGVGAFAAVEKGFSGRGVETRGDRVSVLSPREARGRFFPVVFVPGCSELLFPSASRDARILPFAALEAALRRALPARPVSLYRARDVERQLSDEHHLMYIALTRSLERLYITAPKTLLDEEYPVPSAVLERSVPEKCYTETSSENKTPPQIRFAGMWAANASGRAAATALDRLSPAGAQWHAAKPEAVAVALEPFRLSQSSLRDFLKCERQFFYRKVLRIHEPDSPSALVGRLLHDVMSELGGWFPSKIELLSGATPEVVHVAIDNALQRAGAVAKRSFLERALHYHLGGVVERILDIERSDPENTTIVATELPIDFSRGPWEFTGRIDRIDETTAGARVIIDYKTGKFDKQASTLRKKTLSALQEPKKANWQVPLYVWGMRATEGRYPRAFRLVVAPTKDKPFEVVLFVFRTESDVPPHLKKGRGPSYVVETEIEEIMDRATRIAETIFSPRVRFEKTDDLGACRFCGFARLCGRESG